MELSEIILAFVSVLSAITGGVVKSIMKDIKDLERTMTNCQSNMPINYVLKTDYKTEMSELKVMIESQSRKIDQIWKHMRVEK